MTSEGRTLAGKRRKATKGTEPVTFGKDGMAPACASENSLNYGQELGRAALGESEHTAFG